MTRTFRGRHDWRPMLALGAAALLLTACDARATGPNPSAVASITLTLPSPIMAAGRTDRIAATLLDHAGHKISGLTPEWSSSDQSVVAIDGTGEVRTVAAGSSTITATVGTAKASIVIDVAPASIPFLNRPFQGTYALVNPVDHDVPEEFVDDNGVQIDWTGETSHFLDGHSGYDWELPEGTPVLAAQDGRINIAGRETPFSCPLLNGDTVAALLVNVLHQAPTGELFASLYYHLSRVDVTVGDSVQAGEQLGLSGNTGCSTGPHLHFEVIRELYTRDGFRNGVVTDPYGWIGTQDDPWLLDAHGAVSSNLWLPDQAPQGVLTVDAAQRARGSSNVAKPRILDVDRFTPSLHLAPMRRGKKNPP